MSVFVMSFLKEIVCFFTVVAAIAALPAENLTESCTITSFSQVSSVVDSCTNIVVSNLVVPGGQALNLHLKTGASLTFHGTTKFEHTQWDGPLVVITGKKVMVQGESGSILDGQGGLYWDGKAPTKKPVFVNIKTTGGSVVKNINLLNCPNRCTSVQSSDLTISGWNIDVSAGHDKAKNTDGFDVSSSHNVIIKDSVVKNQDDCVAINRGTNLYFSNLECHGGHGLSLSVGLSKTDPSSNVVSDVTFTDCKVIDSANGIHVKTHPDGTTGSISRVTYQNIQLSGIANFGVQIQEDYGNPGHAKANVPITDLKLIQVTGKVAGSKAMPVNIVCATGGCSDWNWSKVSITGGHKKSSCNFKPSGYSC